jgi:hypothetical protein
MTGGKAQGVALSSNSRTTKKKKKERKIILINQIFLFTRLRI